MVTAIAMVVLAVVAVLAWLWVGRRLRMGPLVLVLSVLVGACVTTPPEGPVEPPPPVVVPPEPIEPPAVDPWESVTTEQLRNWRGSISTVLAPLPCGPRPYAADNVMFTAKIDTSCWSAEDRQTAYAAYRAHGYTHWAMGPLAQTGYHGTFPDSDFRQNPDVFLDRVEEVWRAGFIPVIFLLPDNGICATGSSVDFACVRAELDPIYRSPRFQALAKVVVQAWEPNDWTPMIWRQVTQWMADVFPKAHRYHHYESNYWAPCKGRDFVTPIKTGGDCFRFSKSELLHGVLIQETWSWGGEEGYMEHGRTPEQQVAYDFWDYGRRLVDGYAETDKDFPPSAWGPGIPLDLVAFEYASYYVYRDASRAPASIRMGQLLMDPSAAFRDPVTGAWVEPSKYLRGFGDGGK
jgi:hypothetical protein